MIKTILFDLDGTLLPMDIDHFMEIYFGEMSKMFESHMDKKTLIDTVMKATGAMVKDTGERTNQAVFMETFEQLSGCDIEQFQEIWNRFYDSTYELAQASSSVSKEAKEAIHILKNKGYQLVLATNPLFPKQAIISRIYWAGLNPDDFVYITSFEENHACKPQPAFYQEILSDLSLTPETCMMVGNDTREDMVASTLGIKTYLIEDCILDRGEDSFIVDYRGSWDDFLNHIQLNL